MGNNDRKVFLFQVEYSWTETQLTAFIFCSVYVPPPPLPHHSFCERIMQGGKTGGMERINCKRPTHFFVVVIHYVAPIPPAITTSYLFLCESFFSLCSSYCLPMQADDGGRGWDDRITINVPLFKKLRDLIFFCGTITLSDSYPAFFLPIATTSNKNF